MRGSSVGAAAAGCLGSSADDANDDAGAGAKRCGGAMVAVGAGATCSAPGAVWGALLSSRQARERRSDLSSSPLVRGPPAAPLQWRLTNLSGRGRAALRQGWRDEAARRSGGTAQSPSERPREDRGKSRQGGPGVRVGALGLGELTSE